jgi:riboflavin synthase
VFTGLIDDVGTIDQVATTAAGRELRVRCGYEGLLPGESVAINGVCLTVRECGAGWFTVAAIGPTLDRTTIGTWGTGRRVNLERAMRADSRLGGHIVQGHADGIATVNRVHERGDARIVMVVLPLDVAELCVPHGSIAIDGVSLTIDFFGGHWVEVALIEYTLRHTTLGDLADGDTVNVEGDVIGKYVRRLVQPYRDGGEAPPPDQFITTS